MWFVTHTAHNKQSTTAEQDRALTQNKQQLSEEKGGAEVVVGESESPKKKHHSKSSHMSRLKKELKAEQEKRVSLEAQACTLNQAVQALNDDLRQTLEEYERLNQQYAALVAASEAREKELKALQQGCEFAHTRMARQVTQVSEMVGANKYSIQTNTQKVQQLETHVRDLVRSNKSVVTSVILPYALKCVLALMSLVLYIVSCVVRAA